MKVKLIAQQLVIKEEPTAQWRDSSFSLTTHVLIAVWWFGALLPMRKACRTNSVEVLLPWLVRFGEQASVLDTRKAHEPTLHTERSNPDHPAEEGHLPAQ